MIDKSLSRGLADRVLDEMSGHAHEYTRRLGQIFPNFPEKRHAIQHVARALTTAGEVCCLTQIIASHPKWRWVSSCAFLPAVHPRPDGAERTMAFLAVRTYSHMDRLSFLDQEPVVSLSVNEHAVERLFQRMNVRDPAAVKEELHDAMCMSVCLLSAATRARLSQVVLPTRSGAFLCSVEGAQLVAKTWIADSERMGRHTEPARLARHHFAEAGGEQGLGAEIGSLPIGLPPSAIGCSRELTQALSGIAWLQEPYVPRADPVGDTWKHARGQQQSEMPAP